MLRRPLIASVTILLFGGCAGEPEPREPPLRIVLGETAAAPQETPGPPTLDGYTGITDEERACLWQWMDRSLPPTVEAAVPPAISRQPSLERIRTWSGSVVALGWRGAYRVDDETGHLTHLEIPGCPSVMDLDETRRTLFALCSEEDDLYLMTRGKQQRDTWEVSLDLPKSDFFPQGSLADLANGPWGRLAVSDDAAAVVGSEALWWRSAGDAEWRRYELAAVPLVVDSRLPPDVAFLAPDALLLAWDYGEFGDWFFRIEASPVDGPTGDSERIVAPAVSSVVMDADGVVWVGAGGFEMAGATGQVLAIEGRTVRTVLDEDARRCEPVGDGPHLPQPATIHGLTLDAEGRPLILTEDLGVFRLDDDTLVPLIGMNLGLDYRLDNGVIMGDHPVGLVATERGIYVASRSLGVYAFLDRDDGYEFKQIVRP